MLTAEVAQEPPTGRKGRVPVNCEGKTRSHEQKHAYVVTAKVDDIRIEDAAADPLSQSRWQIIKLR